MVSVGSPGLEFTFWCFDCVVHLFSLPESRICRNTGFQRNPKLSQSDFTIFYNHIHLIPKRAHCAGEKKDTCCCYGHLSRRFLLCYTVAPRSDPQNRMNPYGFLLPRTSRTCQWRASRVKQFKHLALDSCQRRNNFDPQEGNQTEHLTSFQLFLWAPIFLNALFQLQKTALSLYFSYLHPTFWCSLHFACTLNVLNQANGITCNNWIIIRFITVWLCCHLWRIPCCNLKHLETVYCNLFLMATSPQAASQLPILEPVSQRMNMCSGTPIFSFWLVILEHSLLLGCKAGSTFFLRFPFIVNLPSDLLRKMKAFPLKSINFYIQIMGNKIIYEK